MDLKQFRVRKSATSWTESITVDPAVTCLVGMNEAGQDAEAYPSQELFVRTDDEAFLRTPRG